MPPRKKKTEESPAAPPPVPEPSIGTGDERTLSQQIHRIEVYLSQPRFSIFLSNDIGDAIVGVMKDIRRTLRDIPDVDTGLLTTTRAMAMAEYAASAIRGILDANQDDLDRLSSKLRSEGFVELRRSTPKPTQQMLQDWLVVQPSYIELLGSCRALQELSSLTDGLKKTIDRRFRALEHVSNNQRQDHRDSRI